MRSWPRERGAQDPSASTDGAVGRSAVRFWSMAKCDDGLEGREDQNREARELLAQPLKSDQALGRGGAFVTWCDSFGSKEGHRLEFHSSAGRNSGNRVQPMDCAKRRVIPPCRTCDHGSVIVVAVLGNFIMQLPRSPQP